MHTGQQKFSALRSCRSKMGGNYHSKLLVVSKSDPITK